MKTLLDLPSEEPSYFRELTEKEAKELTKACMADMSSKVPPVNEAIVLELETLPTGSIAQVAARFIRIGASLGYQISRGSLYWILKISKSPQEMMVLFYAIYSWAHRKNAQVITLENLAEQIFPKGLPTKAAYDIVWTNDISQIGAWQKLRREKSQ